MWRLPALQWAPCVQHKWGCLWWVWWPLLRASGRRSWGTQSIAWWPACRTHRSDATGTAICLKHQLYVSVVKWGSGVKLQICVCYTKLYLPKSKTNRYTKLYLPKSKTNQKQHQRQKSENALIAKVSSIPNNEHEGVKIYANDYHHQCLTRLTYNSLWKMARCTSPHICSF